jgi:C4-dicarboxylate-specific signal transduction histidine kinase
MICEESRTHGYLRDREIDMRTKAGKIRNTIFSGEEIDVGDDPCFITIIRDVTEQRRVEMESQKQQAQLTHLTRVALLGELSGALAHELNQPLTAILTNAQAAQRFLARDDVELDEIREILGDIIDENKRAGEVIRRLRALFMKGDPKLQPIELGGLVREALDLAHGDLVARNVTVVVRLKPDLGPVRGDRVQLQQVLLNLIINACEAMSGNAPDKQELVFLGDAEDDGSMWIAISDTGPGIPPEAVDHVFDTFFTTKVHGLGFGLSISRSIVAAHGGRIEVMNNPGGGAMFRITFPTQSGGRP